MELRSSQLQLRQMSSIIDPSASMENSGCFLPTKPSDLLRGFLICHIAYRFASSISDSTKFESCIVQRSMILPITSPPRKVENIYEENTETVHKGKQRRKVSTEPDLPTGAGSEAGEFGLRGRISAQYAIPGTRLCPSACNAAILGSPRKIRELARDVGLSHEHKAAGNNRGKCRAGQHGLQREICTAFVQSFGAEYTLEFLLSCIEAMILPW